MAPPAKKRRTRAAAAAEAAAAEAEQEQEQESNVEQTTTTKQKKEDDSAKQIEPESKPVPAEAAVDPVAEATTEVTTKPQTELQTEPQVESQNELEEPSTSIDTAAKAKERMARFKALQARAKTSSETNLKEATKESQRLASDPSQLTALHRKHAIASHKLLKADVEESGEDFERKRAWDWTIDESERWDKRVKKRAAHKDNNAFRDGHQEGNKVYKRQLRNIKPDLEQYDKQKKAAIDKAAASGGLEIVETEDGELIAVDKDGSFYSTADSTTFTQNRPDKAAVDRLVDDLRRAEEQRLKKRKERMAKSGDEGDITYINEKNKQFNQKLSRFYDKYTADIRDSFERGTMI